MSRLRSGMGFGYRVAGEYLELANVLILLAMGVVLYSGNLIEGWRVQLLIAIGTTHWPFPPPRV